MSSEDSHDYVVCVLPRLALWVLLSTSTMALTMMLTRRRARKSVTWCLQEFALYKVICSGS